MHDGSTRRDDISGDRCAAAPHRPPDVTRHAGSALRVCGPCGCAAVRSSAVGLRYIHKRNNEVRTGGAQSHLVRCYLESWCCATIHGYPCVSLISPWVTTPVKRFYVYKSRERHRQVVIAASAFAFGSDLQHSVPVHGFADCRLGPLATRLALGVVLPLCIDVCCFPPGPVSAFLQLHANARRGKRIIIKTT